MRAAYLRSFPVVLTEATADQLELDDPAVARTRNQYAVPDCKPVTVAAVPATFKLLVVVKSESVAASTV